MTETSNSTGNLDRRCPAAPRLRDGAPATQVSGVDYDTLARIYWGLIALLEDPAAETGFSSNRAT